MTPNTTDRLTDTDVSAITEHAITHSERCRAASCGAPRPINSRPWRAGWTAAAVLEIAKYPGAAAEAHVQAAPLGAP